MFPGTTLAGQVSDQDVNVTPPSGAPPNPSATLSENMDVDGGQGSATDGTGHVVATPGDAGQDVPFLDQQTVVFHVQRPGQGAMELRVRRSEVDRIDREAEELLRSNLTLKTQGGQCLSPADCKFVNPETDGIVRSLGAPS